LTEETPCYESFIIAITLNIPAGFFKEDSTKITSFWQDGFFHSSQKPEAALHEANHKALS
jgi:hypothetical protein